MNIDPSTSIITSHTGSQLNRRTAPTDRHNGDAGPAASSSSPAKELAEKYDVRNMSPDDVWHMMAEGAATGVFPESSSGKWLLLGGPGDKIALDNPGLHTREKTDVVKMVSDSLDYNKSVNNQQAVELYESLLSRLKMMDSLRGADVPAAV